jgi:hypothetical protein
MRKSPGIKLPAVSTTTSPGTISSSGTSASLPLRSTVAVVFTIFCSFSTARDERASWMYERKTLRNSMPPTTTVERTSPMR